MTDQPGLHCTNGHAPPSVKAASKFCTLCGAPMVVTCSHGHEVKPAPYCSVCGAPLPPTGLPPPADDTVTAPVFGSRPADAGLGGGTAMAVPQPPGKGPAEMPRPPRGPHKHGRGPPPLVIVGAVLVAILIGVGAYFGITELTSSDSEKPAGPVPTMRAPSPTTDATVPPQPTEQSPGSPSTQPVSPTTPPPSAKAGPADTVEAYFAAINAGDYKRAWELGGNNVTPGPYSSFVKEFEGTASDSVTVISVAGDRVEIELDATQTDGTHRYFAGTYTVRGGVIVAANIQRQ